MKWENKVFKNIIELQRGFDLPKSKFIKGLYNVYGSTSILGTHNECKVKGPGVIMGRSGTLGNLQYSIDDFWPHNTSLWVKDFKGNNPKFIFYLLKTIDYTKFNSGGAVPTLNRNTLSELELKIPTLEIQTKIANILSKYDDLIENNLKRIELLEEAAQRLYKEWFIDLRFPGYEKVKIVDGIPEGWEKKSIMDFNSFEFIKENVKKFDGEKIYYATADIDGYKIISCGEKINWENKPSRAQKKAQKNSVWFARMKEANKVIYFSEKFENTDDIILSSGFAGFKSISNLALPYLFVLINSKTFKGLRDSHATGATQVSLNNDGLAKIEFIEPPLYLIESYGEIAFNLLNKITILDRQNQKLTEARDRLLPKLMKGEIEI